MPGMLSIHRCQFDLVVMVMRVSIYRGMFPIQFGEARRVSLGHNEQYWTMASQGCDNTQGCTIISSTQLERKPYLTANSINHSPAGNALCKEAPTIQE